MTLTDKFIKSAARDNLMYFVLSLMPDYMLAPHNRLIFQKLNDIESGKIKRLMINVSPRSGKSLLASQYFPSWYLGRNPDKRVICATYGQDLADSFGRQVRNTLRDHKYQAIFPDTIMAEDSSSIKKFATTQGGKYIAVGAQGALTGEGGDCLVGSTQVMTEVGPKTIKEICESARPPKVLSYGKKDVCQFKEVVAARKIESRLVLKIKISQGEDLTCTPDHKIYIDGKGYVKAQDIMIGDKLISPYRATTTKYQVVKTKFVTAIETSNEMEDVYDIQVRDNHNFFANGVLVHNCIIIDDPLKNRVDANSPKIRSNLIDWFKSTLYTRLSPNGSIIILQTRWHQEDLSGYLLNNEPDKWEVINIPAINELGESYWPERWPVNKLIEIKETIGSYEFAALYQQTPTPRNEGMFQRHWFEIVDAVPSNLTYVRGWDRAASVPKDGSDPDWTVGIKMGKSKDGVFYVTDMVRMRGSSLDVQNTIKNTATRDGYPCKIVLEQDPGQAGKAEAEYLIRMLQGFNVKAVPVKKDKITRAGPFSAQCEAGNVKLLRGQWNEAFLSELEMFPFGQHDDINDGASCAFNALTQPGLNYEGLTVL